MDPNLEECHVCPDVRPESPHIDCRILLYLQVAWPYPATTGQLAKVGGITEGEVEASVDRLRAMNEDIIRTPEPSGENQQVSWQYRWPQPILTSQIRPGKTSADPA